MGSKEKLEANILVVEDTPETQMLIKASLRQFSVTVVGTLADATEEIEGDVAFDMILLDVGLPDGDGFSYFANLQAKCGPELPPVLFLTGKTNKADMVMAFSLGAHDFISKPFKPLELLSRVQDRIIKTRNVAQADQKVKYGDLLLDPENHIAKWKNQDLEASRLEIKILQLLASRDGKPIDLEEFATEVWGHGVPISEETAGIHLDSLKNKLAETKLQLVKSKSSEISLKVA